MRQSNGSQLFHANDPRSTTIGIIEADLDDSRQSIVTAILTQEKLGRKQTVVVIPDTNTAFRRTNDFAVLQQTLDGVQTQVIFVVTPDTPVAKFARRQHLSVFASLELYAQYARTFISQDVDKATLTPTNGPTMPPEETNEEAEEVNVPNPPPVLAAPAIEDEATRPLLGPQITTEDIPLAAPASSQPNHDTEDQTGPLPIILGARPEQQPDQVPLPLQASPLHENAVHAPPKRPEQPMEPAQIKKQSPGTDLVAAEPAPVTRPVRTSNARRRVGRRSNLAILLLVIILLIAGILFGSFEGVGPLAHFFSDGTATITITPKSTFLKQIYTLSTTTQPDPAQRQIAAHFLAIKMPPKTQTVHASGQGMTQGTAASGQLTFYNPQPQIVIIPGGTVLTDGQGIKVITSGDTQLAAAQPPQESSTTVPAQALQAGQAGNISASDINTPLCCQFAGVTVRNPQPFTGGIDQQPFSYIQQSDIDAAVLSLEKTLIPDGQQKVQNQLQPNEQMVAPAQCTPIITADYEAGQQATAVPVTVNETCIGEVYNQDGALSLAANLLKIDATQRPGRDYTLAGSIKTTIISTNTPGPQGTFILKVEANGIWVYRFQHDWVQQIAKGIAGKDINAAQSLLQKQPGVKNANIVMARGAGDTLPTGIQKIHIQVQFIAGV